MQRVYRMRRNAHFQFVYRRGKPASGRLMTLLFAPGKRVSVGFSVSKKIGGSVKRNYVKRRLREAFRQTIPALRRGSYVVVAKPPAGEADFHAMQAELLRLLRKVACMKSEP